MGNFLTVGPTKGTGSGAFQTDGTISARVDQGTKLLLERASGISEVGFAAIMSQDPVLSWTCMDLLTMLTSGNIGILGNKVPNSTVLTGIEQYFAQMEENGDRVSGSNHMKITGAYGRVLPTKLVLKQDAKGTLDCELHAGWDGTNDPLVVTTSVSLPSVTLDEIFTLGPVYVAGSQLTPEHVKGVTHTWKWDIGKERGSGEKWPRRIHIRTFEQMTQVEMDDALNLSSYGLIGDAFGASSVQFYAQKMLVNSDRVPAATSAHLKFSGSASQGIILPSDMAVENGNPSTNMLTFHYTKGSSAGLVFTPSTTIP